MIRIFTVVNCINFIILKRKTATTITPSIAKLPTTFRTNNLAENPPLLTDSQLIVVVLILAMSSTPVLLLKHAKTIDTLILTGVPFQLTMGVIVPSLVYLFNPNLRDFIWSELFPDNMKDLYEKARQRLKKVEGSSEANATVTELDKKLDFTNEIIQHCEQSTSLVETCGCRLRLHLLEAAENDPLFFNFEF